ncbi:MAG: FtsX-like permease family protein [Bacteroidales bacterium]
MIWKILKQEFKIHQSIIIAAVMFTGFSIIILAARFYADIRPAFTSQDLWTTEHLIISKDISGLSTTGQLLGNKEKPSFSQEEIEALKDQDFITELAPFTPSSFQARVYTVNDELGGFYSDIFFESVPSRYIDLEDQEWNWSPAEKYIPVILPKTYLNLYNFGFASAQNLPQISEEAAGMIPFRVVVKGNGKQGEFLARIVGFSDRLNTILVPASFLEYANPKFGTKEPPVSRLILLTPDPSDTELLEYIKSKGYDYNKEQLKSGKARLLLNTATVVVVVTGLLISLLALGMFILSSQLLLQKNKTNIHFLLALGYSHRQIVQPFIKLNALTSGLVFILSLLPFFLVSKAYSDALGTILSEDPLPDLWILAGGFILLAMFSGFNILSTYKQVKRL